MKDEENMAQAFEDLRHASIARSPTGFTDKVMRQLRLQKPPDFLPSPLLLLGATSLGAAAAAIVFTISIVSHSKELPPPLPEFAESPAGHLF